MVIKKRLYAISGVLLCFCSIISTKVLAKEAGNDNDVELFLIFPPTLTCDLSYQSIHGMVDKVIKHQSLDSCNFTDFTMRGGLFYGPDVKITYNNCINRGEATGYSISFEVTQPYSFLKGHEPTITILSSTGLTLNYQMKQASSFQPYSPGMLGVSIDVGAPGLF